MTKWFSYRFFPDVSIHGGIDQQSPAHMHPESRLPIHHRYPAHQASVESIDWWGAT